MKNEFQKNLAPSSDSNKLSHYFTDYRIVLYRYFIVNLSMYSIVLQFTQSLNVFIEYFL